MSEGGGHVQFVPALLLTLFHCRKVVDGLLGGKRRIFRGGGAQERHDHAQHLYVVLSLEQCLAAQQLRENAADTPHVDCASVVSSSKEELRGTIPSRDDVAGQHALCWVRGHASKSQVAYLEIAVGIHEKIVGLEVAMDHARTVHVPGYNVTKSE
jgi:hypothetical protein